jgi:uncharacterized protein YihD (DUF1040 family)
MELRELKEFSDTLSDLVDVTEKIAALRGFEVNYSKLDEVIIEAIKGTELEGVLTLPVIKKEKD